MMMTLSDMVGIVKYIKETLKQYQLDTFIEIKSSDKLATVWYDILRDDKKQEWILLKNDGDIEANFYFKSAYRPNDFMATETTSGEHSRFVILGVGSWDVQVLE